MTDEQRKLAIDALKLLGIPFLAEPDGETLAPEDTYAWEHGAQIIVAGAPSGATLIWCPWINFDQARHVAEAVAGLLPPEEGEHSWIVVCDTDASGRRTYTAAVYYKQGPQTDHAAEALLRAALAAAEAKP